MEVGLIIYEKKKKKKNLREIASLHGDSPPACLSQRGKRGDPPLPFDKGWGLLVEANIQHIFF
jgi:hypothetical protein